MSWGYTSDDTQIDTQSFGIDAGGRSDAQTDYSLAQTSQFAQSNSTISQEHIDAMYDRIDNTVRLMIAQGRSDDDIHAAVANMAHPELRAVAAERVDGHLEAASYSLSPDRNGSDLSQEEEQSLFASVSNAINPLFASLSPGAMGRINGLNQDTQMVIAEEGARLTESSVGHNPSDPIRTLADALERGPDRTPATGIERDKGAGFALG